MQDFQRSNNFGGSRGHRSSSGRGGNGGGDREMFDAVCVNCGKNCRVPFKPTSGKPIYCSDCFESVEKDRDNGDFSRAPRRNSYDRPQSDRPRFDRPAYTPRREMPQAAPKLDLTELNQKFDELNDKLDLILHSLAHKAETPQE